MNIVTKRGSQRSTINVNLVSFNYWNPVAGTNKWHINVYAKYEAKEGVLIQNVERRSYEDSNSKVKR